MARLCAAALIILLFAAGCASHRRPSVTLPAPQPALTFVATAYCQSGRTAAGVVVREGIAAADPRVLPIGTVVRVDNAAAYTGIYTILDTGSRIQGRRIDLFVRDCRRARQFGRRTVAVSVIRTGAAATR